MGNRKKRGKSKQASKLPTARNTQISEVNLNQSPNIQEKKIGSAALSTLKDSDSLYGYLARSLKNIQPKLSSAPQLTNSAHLNPHERNQNFIFDLVDQMMMEECEFDDFLDDDAEEYDEDHCPDDHYNHNHNHTSFLQQHQHQYNYNHNHVHGNETHHNNVHSHPQSSPDDSICCYFHRIHNSQTHTHSGDHIYNSPGHSLSTPPSGSSKNYSHLNNRLGSSIDNKLAVNLVTTQDEPSFPCECHICTANSRVHPHHLENSTSQDEADDRHINALNENAPYDSEYDDYDESPYGFCNDEGCTCHFEQREWFRDYQNRIRSQLIHQRFLAYEERRIQGLSFEKNTTPIAVAIREGTFEDAKKVVTRKTVDTNLGLGNTPLHFAAQFDNMEVAVLICEQLHGIQYIRQENDFGMSPFDLVAEDKMNHQDLYAYFESVVNNEMNEFLAELEQEEKQKEVKKAKKKAKKQKQKLKNKENCKGNNSVRDSKKPNDSEAKSEKQKQNNEENIDHKVKVQTNPYSKAETKREGEAPHTQEVFSGKFSALANPPGPASINSASKLKQESGTEKNTQLPQKRNDKKRFNTNEEAVKNPNENSKDRAISEKNHVNITNNGNAPVQQGFKTVKQRDKPKHSKEPEKSDVDKESQTVKSGTIGTGNQNEKKETRSKPEKAPTLDSFPELVKPEVKESIKLGSSEQSILNFHQIPTHPSTTTQFLSIQPSHEESHVEHGDDSGGSSVDQYSDDLDATAQVIMSSLGL